jgi:hypothetical protein
MNQTMKQIELKEQPNSAAKHGINSMMFVYSQTRQKQLLHLFSMTCFCAFM